LLKTNYINVLLIVV